MNDNTAAHVGGTERPTLVLIDGHALAYRAYFALPPDMATTKGELTNAVYGFTTMLIEVLEEIRPDYIAVAFDVGRTFRHDTYEEYKAHRVKQPDELRTQVQRIKELVEALNVPIFAIDGFEADDVIGTLARQAEEQDVEVLIVTGDTDTFQLVDDHTRVLTSGRRFSDTKIYDVAAVRERYSLEPAQLVEYKALVGDSSDNIPGVRGVGDKTATKLLQQYPSVEEIYAHLDEISSTRARNALAGAREDAMLSKALARIRTNVPIELDLEACRTRDFDRDHVLALFRELEFKSLINRIPAPAGGEAETPETEAERSVTYHLVNTEEKLDELEGRLQDAEFITFDVETDSLDTMSASLVGLSLSIEEGEGYYVPVGHAGLEGVTHNLPLEQVREVVGPYLADSEVPTRAHNAKFDLLMLHRHGFNVTNVDFDTMIAAWLVNPGGRNYGLKDLAFDRLGVEMTPITELIGEKRKNQISIGEVPIDDVAPYACADVDMTTRLVRVLSEELGVRNAWDLFDTVEMPLVPVLVDMELAGVALDVEALADLHNELQSRLHAVEAQIFDHVGYEFNVNSGPQLSEALFETLELSTQPSTRTKTGYYSTAANVLEALRTEHPVPDLVLEYRHLQKLLSTYVDQLPTMVNEETGRIHTDLNQTGTETGRLSSSNPNLQNIPIRTEIGRQIRKAFVAAPGCVLLSADYSQIELRVLAHLSGDEKLVAAFERGEDIHRATAATIIGVAPEDVTPEMRTIAKRINFGLLYGMSAWRLARDTGLSREEAEIFLERYFANYPSVRGFLDRIVEEARERGYTETILGRRRYFPELLAGDRTHTRVRRAAERAAKNHPIQGSAADIIKVAMINLHDRMSREGLQTRMTLQVHDELLFEVPEDELDVVAEMVPGMMSRAYELTVPVKVDAKVGYNWHEMVSLDEFVLT